MVQIQTVIDRAVMAVVSDWKSALNYRVVIDHTTVPLKPLLRGEGVRLGHAFIDVLLFLDG